MEEIKRGRVPFRRTTPPQTGPNQEVGALAAQQQPDAIKLRKAPKLKRATEAAFRGNKLTGATLDARKDLPPFGFNPSPKHVYAKNAEKMAKTYAPPPRAERHPSAGDLSRLFDPATRQAAKLQRVLNVNPLVRSAFEKTAGAVVARDGRMDGTVSLIEAPSGSIGVSTGAMSGMSNAPQRDFYYLLAQMDQAVMAQAANVAATTESSTGAWNPGDSFPTFPIGTGLGLDGGSDGLTAISDDEEGSQAQGFTQGFNPNSTNNFLPNSPSAQTNQAGPTDVAAQKVQAAIQRLTQMYQLISGMFSKYNGAATTALNNIR